MRKKFILFVLIGILASQAFCRNARDLSPESPDSSLIPDRTLKPWRLGTVVALSTSSFAASYFFILKEAWWEDQGEDFHFSHDFEYALNLDKAGHFFGGLVISEMFFDGLTWSGVSEFNSYLYASLLSSFVQVGIDFKDGFSPQWGYSPWDVAMGSLGAFMPMLDRYVPGMKWFDFKFSYWKNTNAYYERSEVGFVGDDYVNQTYWVAFKVNEVLPRGLEGMWPDFVVPAVGLSVDEGLYQQGFKAGSREVYLSLDWDLENLVRVRSPYWRRTLSYLNMIKFPSPTLQVYPFREFHWAYPIRF